MGGDELPARHGLKTALLRQRERSCSRSVLREAIGGSLRLRATAGAGSQETGENADEGREWRIAEHGRVVLTCSKGNHWRSCFSRIGFPGPACVFPTLFAAGIVAALRQAVRMRNAACAVSSRQGVCAWFWYSFVLGATSWTCVSRQASWAFVKHGPGCCCAAMPIELQSRQAARMLACHCTMPACVVTLSSLSCQWKCRKSCNSGALPENNMPLRYNMCKPMFHATPIHALPTRQMHHMQGCSIP